MAVVLLVVEVIESCVKRGGENLVSSGCSLRLSSLESCCMVDDGGIGIRSVVIALGSWFVETRGSHH
jgi:hypothetical protein